MAFSDDHREAFSEFIAENDVPSEDMLEEYLNRTEGLFNTMLDLYERDDDTEYTNALQALLALPDPRVVAGLITFALFKYTEARDGKR